MIVILGGGIAGLLAAYALREHKPLLLEAKPTLGGNYTAGGLKYIRKTPGMIKLLDDLDLTWVEYQPRGVMYLDGDVHRHPEWLNANVANRHAIQKMHWFKTRGTSVGFRPDCMNDPMGNGAAVALKCDHEAMLSRLISKVHQSGVQIFCDVKIKSIGVAGIEWTTDGWDMLTPYKHLVPTIPLGALAKLAPWARLPDAQARPLGIIEFQAEPDGLPGWDYMYTPYLSTVSRIVWTRLGVFQAEVPGVSNVNVDVTLDAKSETGAALRNYAHSLQAIRAAVIPGHLEPLSHSLRWPEQWHPLGRFTEWNPRATAEHVLASAQAVASQITSV